MGSRSKSPLNKHKIVFLCLLSFLFLISCGDFTGFQRDSDPDTGDISQFRLYLGEGALATLYDSLSLDVYASCRYTSDLKGASYGDARIRIRGFTSRMKPKKSFTLAVRKNGKTLKYALDASGDPWISYGLIMYAYQLVGLPAPQLEPVALYLNDEYMGLYSCIPLYDEKLDSFYHEKGELFKIKASHMGSGISAEEDSEKKYPHNDDYSSLNRFFINAANMGREDWVEWIEEKADLESIAAYMVIRDYFGMADTYRANFYIYHGDRYRILSWDNDHYFNDTGEVGGNNLITRRMLESPDFQDFYRDYFNRFLLDRDHRDNILEELEVFASELARQIDRAVDVEAVFYLKYSDFIDEQGSLSDFFLIRGSKILSAPQWSSFFNEK